MRYSRNCYVSLSVYRNIQMIPVCAGVLMFIVLSANLHFGGCEDKRKMIKITYVLSSRATSDGCSSCHGCV